MTYKNLTLSCLFILLATGKVICQKKRSEYNSEPFHKYTHEIGLNVSNVLGNIFSLNPDSDPYPYLLTYRKHINKNYTFRSGINLNIDQNTNTEFDNNNFLERQLQLIQSDVRLGFEKKMTLSTRFLCSYGIDFLGRYRQEKSQVRDFNFNSFNSFEQTLGGGLGPVLRFEFKISERMFLSIESSFYGLYSRTKETIDINGVQGDEPTITEFNLELVLPRSLFFNVAF